MSTSISDGESSTRTNPTVSVIIVNYRNADDTIAAVASLSELDWDRRMLEVVVVDNSADGSAELIRDAVPWALVVDTGENLGFGGGCNRGAVESSGQYLAFLNNDARATPGWIRAAVDVMQRDDSVGCVASKVLNEDGTVIDYVDAAMTFYGHAFNLHQGDRDDGTFDESRDVLFAMGAGMVVPRPVFHALRGFDATYFLNFEDVDFGWRTWLAGYRVRYVPDSVVLHRGHGSISGLGYWRELFLLERNALATLFKNLDEANLAAFLPAALLLSTRRGMERSEQDPGEMDPEKRASTDADATSNVHRHGLASMHAQDAFLTMLPALKPVREWIQATRQIDDQRVLSLFRRPFANVCPTDRSDAGLIAARDVFAIDRAFSARRILVVTSDVVGPRMAGPAIRAVQISGALADEHDVILVSLNSASGSHPNFRILDVKDEPIEDLVGWAEIIVFQGFFLSSHSWVPGLERKILVTDLYDPFQLEHLELFKHLEITDRERENHSAVGVLNEQITRGDFFMCASEKQRDFWLGNLASLGRLNPKVYDDDASLRRVLDVVPFGIPESPPEQTGPAFREVVPGIGAEDKVLLWGGGIYNWFDPCTLIRAVGELRDAIPTLRLLFMGTKHPNADVPEMRVAVEAVALAEELDLVDSHVFFNDGWVPYDDRHNFLLEADLGVSTHFQHIETAFSFRTRVLDYIWAGLPIISTDGDALSSIVRERGLGLTVPEQDVDALAEAIRLLLTSKELYQACLQNVREIRPEFTWGSALRPLLEFCRQADRSADHRYRSVPTAPAPPPPLTKPVQPPPWKWHGVRHDLGVARAMLQEGGVRGLARQSGVRVRRLIGRSDA